MEKPIVCENTTVYDFRAHQRFNELMVGLSQWIMYGVAMLLGALMIVVYVLLRAPVVLIFAITVILLINLMKFVFQPSSLKKTYGQILAHALGFTWGWKDLRKDIWRKKYGEEELQSRLAAIAAKNQAREDAIKTRVRRLFIKKKEK